MKPATRRPSAHLQDMSQLVRHIAPDDCAICLAVGYCAARSPGLLHHQMHRNLHMAHSIDAGAHSPRMSHPFDTGARCPHTSHGIDIGARRLQGRWHGVPRAGRPSIECIKHHTLQSHEW